MITTVSDVKDDVAYEVFSAQIRARFATFAGKPLFNTNVDGLFDVFLANLPAEYRQHYTCNSCRQFVDTFGGLVSISDGGIANPAMWPDGVPVLFENSVSAVLDLLVESTVTGVFLHPKSTWGKPVTGEWNHMSVVDAPVYRHSLKTPFQAMAEKAEDYNILQRSLAEFNQFAVEQAVTLLKTESLYRSEKCLGVAEWLLALQKATGATKNKKTQSNLIWLAVATAPVGYCHVRSSMIGTLLEDIASGMDFGAVSRRFAEKMHPLQYQRPQAAPTTGNIQQAEKLVEKLGIQRSLMRRFARLDEVQALWKPPTQVQGKSGDGVFAHLKAKGQQQPASGIDLPALTMTWEKFQRTVLSTASKIELYIAGGNNSYAALVTAVDPDAPPILQWDSEGRRNPVSWYLYHGGSAPSQWGLVAGKYCPVAAICLSPAHWNGQMPHQVDGVFFLLEGAKDSRNQSLALFPEILKSELREARSVIEAHSKTGKLDSQEEASACGLCLQRNTSAWSATLRVTSGNTHAIYKLDRWD